MEEGNGKIVKEWERVEKSFNWNYSENLIGVKLLSIAYRAL